LRESRVNKEDGRDELLVLRVNRLVGVAAFEQGTESRQHAKDWVLDGLLCVAYRNRDQFIARANVRLVDWSDCLLVEGRREVWELALNIAVVFVGV